MSRETFFRTILVIIALLLLINLFSFRISSLLSSEAAAETAQKLTYRGNGVAIACSDDGKYVYAAGSGRILRSTGYGTPGSWEVVIED